VRPEPEYEPSDPVRLLYPIVVEHVERRYVDLATTVIDLDPEGEVGEHVLATDMDESEESDPSEASSEDIAAMRRRIYGGPQGRVELSSC
jgi:hypothetical protein